jgi:hypothetical protein
VTKLLEAAGLLDAALTAVLGTPDARAAEAISGICNDASSASWGQCSPA